MVRPVGKQPQTPPLRPPVADSCRDDTVLG